VEDIKDAFLAQIDLVLKQYGMIEGEAQDEGFSNISYDTYARFRTAVLTVIDRVAGPDSIYAKEASGFSIDKYALNNLVHIPFLAGIVHALRDDVSRGFLTTARELIHGETFSDFLEMADFLLNEGYKDASAIMGGGVLENHIHNLCIKHEIEITTIKEGNLQQKKTNRLNNDLASAGIYGKLDQKNVTAWLDLRNSAAHAKYDNYLKEQVALLLQGIRDFITRYPA
jgi:hypothetical protein